MWRSFNYSDTYRAVFSATECQTILGMATDSVSGEIAGFRRCRLYWIFRKPETQWAFDRIWATVTRWNEGRFSLEEPTGGLQLARYEEGDRYDWHMDLGPGAMSLRKVTAVVEIVSAAEGGGLEVFYGEGRNLGLVPGDMAILPSWIMHRAVPVIRGVRWSLVCWVLGSAALT